MSTFSDWLLWPQCVFKDPQNRSSCEESVRINWRRRMNVIKSHLRETTWELFSIWEEVPLEEVLEIVPTDNYHVAHEFLKLLIFLASYINLILLAHLHMMLIQFYLLSWQLSQRNEMIIIPINAFLANHLKWWTKV